MNEQVLNLEEKRFLDDVPVDARLPYLRPEVRVECVELENAIAAGSVVTTQQTTTEEWQDGGSETNDIGYWQ